MNAVTVSVRRRLVFISALSISLGASVGCPLDNASFGRDCVESNECGVGYGCLLSEGVCVPDRLLDGEPDAIPTPDGGTEPEPAVEPAVTPTPEGGAEPDPIEPDGGPEIPVPGSSVLLSSPSPIEGGQFGEAVSVSGNTIAIGAPGEERVYVVDVTETGLGLVRILIPPEDVLPGSGYGTSVALLDKYIVVGAPYANFDGEPTEDQGQAYIYFEDEEGGYSTFTFLRATPTNATANFGASVAIGEGAASAIHIAVGEPGAVDALDGRRKGAVSVFRYGVLSEQLTGPEVAYSPDISTTDPLGGFFGESVAWGPLADRLAVAAPGEEIPAANDSHTGRVYVFDRSVLETLSEFDVLEGPNLPIPGRFGSSIAFDGIGRLFVGVTDVDQSDGTVLEFNAVNFALAPGPIRPAAPPAANRHFGGSIAVDDGEMVVGAGRPEFNFLDVNKPAVIYRFSRSGGAYSENTEPTPEFDLGDDSRYGAAVTMSRAVILVGAPGAVDDNAVVSGGAVLIRR